MTESTTTNLPDPKTWVTSSDPMTEKQSTFLKKLCDDHNLPFDENIDKGAASKKINELKNLPLENGNGSGTDNVDDGKDGEVQDEGIEENEKDQGNSDGEQIPSLLSKPSTWTTGHDPITEPQKRYLAVLTKAAGESVEVEDLNKAEASEKIEELKKVTGK